MSGQYREAPPTTAAGAPGNLRHVTTEALPPPTLTAAARPRVSVVVPLLNEEGTVERVHRRIADAFAAGGLDGEMIFIDDGSTDRTLELLTALHEADPRVP